MRVREARAAEPEAFERRQRETGDRDRRQPIRRGAEARIPGRVEHLTVGNSKSEPGPPAQRLMLSSEVPRDGGSSPSSLVEFSKVRQTYSPKPFEVPQIEVSLKRLLSSTQVEHLEPRPAAAVERVPEALEGRRAQVVTWAVKGSLRRSQPSSLRSDISLESRESCHSLSEL